MKINQIIVENKKVDEAPAGMFTQMGRKLGSRALNKIGAKSMAANIAGKADLGATANKLHQQFSGYMGTQNKDISRATGKDLKAFLATKNVSVNVPNGPIDPSRLDKMLLKIARDAMNKKSNSKQPSAPASSGSNQQQPSAPTPTSNKRTQSAYSQTVQAAKKLSAKEKRRLIAQLQKTLPPAGNTQSNSNTVPFKSKRKSATP